MQRMQHNTPAALTAWAAVAHTPLSVELATGRADHLVSLHHQEMVWCVLQVTAAAQTAGGAAAGG